jgi:hypothetical protein
MGVAHLVGKRTGRPKGVRSRPPWERDIRWAYRNLAKADAVPPSVMAGRLLALGRDHPDRLAALLMRLGEAGPAAVAQPAVPHRVRFVTLTRAQVYEWLLYGHSRPWMSRLPDDFTVEVVTVHWKANKVTLLVRSEAFEPVPEREPVPEVRLV